MTRTTNVRIAGATFLLYITVGVAGLIVSGGATRGGDAAARLARMAQHAADVRIAALLGFLKCFVALTLVMALPLELAGVLHGTVAQLICLPMAAFEIPVAC